MTSAAVATPDVRRILVFDTTLRDGEQAPGCAMGRREKLEVARQLARLRVDVIEAGFPAASRGDWEAVHAVASEVGSATGPVICGLARCNAPDIEACATAIAPAARRRIHTFLATSDIHLEHKLRMTRPDVLAAAASMVRFARERCDDVEFSPEDASRSDPLFLYEVLAAAIEAGATTLNIPDTVGYSTPDEYAALIAGIRSDVAGADRVTLSTHCHDDLGLAVANTIAGVRAGAGQVECTVNGIGERAGNAALEEIVMALATRRALHGAETGVRTTEIARTSRLVASVTGMHVPPNKAIVGANAFAHEAGIHQDGVLKHRLTYEIMSAETVGLDGNRLVLGKHSGRHALRARLAAMGHPLDGPDLDRVFASFKELADRRKVIEERDLEALVADLAHSEATPPPFELEEAHVTSSTHDAPQATVTLRMPGGERVTRTAEGSGAVDALCAAINAIAGNPGELVEFSVTAVTEGVDAAGEVTMRVRSPDGTRLESGHGVGTDIVLAAARAYVAACNKLQGREARRGAPGRVSAMRDVAGATVSPVATSSAT
ncbi:MAG: 2-isopropylmalate synthase [Gemmatimonadaceae bacterium]